jgi:NAD(P)-dependent dehydrogenase (short-subunit alcohol dehydrogenase family)
MMVGSPVNRTQDAKKGMIEVLSFEDKVVVVTGGSSGIGRATVVAFARAGAKVVIADIKEEGGHQTVQLVKNAGGEGMFVHADVSHEADVSALMERAVETYGRIDCAFNNAGRELNVGIMDGTEADFDEIVATNTKGVFFCLKHEMQRMRTSGGGAIVNNTSAAGLVPTDVNHLYGMSKRAVTHLTQTAARQGGKLGIRVNEIAPALLMTEMVKGYFEGPNAVPLENVIARLALDHVGQPEDATGAVLFLCSDEASFITGVTLPVDGGFVLYNAGSY